MTTRGMIFDGESIRGMLAGIKTQTSRLMKPQPPAWVDLADPADPRYASSVAVLGTMEWCGRRVWQLGASWGSQPCPKEDEGTLPSLDAPHRPGDLIYAREAFAVPTSGPLSAQPCHLDDIAYKADAAMVDIESPAIRWRPSIHMPKQAARIWLRVTSSEPRRVQSYTPLEIVAEGYVPPEDCALWTLLARRWWRDRWNGLHPTPPFDYDSNPWAWCYKYEILSTTGKPAGLED